VSFDQLCNRHGERLDSTFAGGREGGRELVVIGHGVTSNHERPYLIALGEALAERGVASLRLSFAGNGASGGRFEECTISKEVEDLGCVLDALSGWRVAYAGHSMGAAVGVLRAAGDERLRALVSLAGMTRVQAFVERHFGQLTPGRDCMLDRPSCPLSQTFVEDARRIDTTLAASARVRVPWLLLHGTADELVPLQDSIEAREANAGRARLVELEGADHRFSGRHGELAAIAADWLCAGPLVPVSPR